MFNQIPMRTIIPRSRPTGSSASIQTLRCIPQVKQPSQNGQYQYRLFLASVPVMIVGAVS